MIQSLIDLDAAKTAGVEVRKQCSIPLEDDGINVIVCPEEAVGEITALTEEGIEIPMPICEGHLEWLQNNYSKKLDNA